ncbi:hypothetical protein B0H17DRAFT_1197622 [Mycena rosella]|uniref:Uncharacterized protein n=1 Tax=Mycena rosella TaxID=1033263 RepID=A0AAD7DSG6_MYCRO|nr:hypothetical protein B0H17DRAFT_1197622 [Mycena rosella]
MSYRRTFPNSDHVTVSRPYFKPSLDVKTSKLIARQAHNSSQFFFMCTLHTLMAFLSLPRSFVWTQHRRALPSAWIVSFIVAQILKFHVFLAHQTFARVQ